MSVNGSDGAMVLCIDSNVDVLNLLENVLTGAGYKVITAQDGGRGLIEARNKRPELILLNVLLPKSDGYAVCSQLQAGPETAYIPVVFLTVPDGEVDRARAFAAGAADFLAKPVQKDILLAKVEAQLKTGLHWQKLKDMVVLWDGLVQPPHFSGFKQSLMERLNLAPPVRDRLAWTAPLDIYRMCALMGIPRGQMTVWMADFLSFPLLSTIDPASLLSGIIPVSLARENRVAAMSAANGSRSFILSNPFDTVLLDILKTHFGLQKDSVINLADPDNFDILFGQSDEVSVTTGYARPERPGEIAAEPAVMMSSTDEETHPVASIANKILASAVSKRASVISIEPTELDARVRFRIDDDMRDVFSMKKDSAVMLISRFKEIAGLDVTGENKAQDGTLAAVISGRTFKLRLAAASTPAGESLIIRLLEPGARAKKMQSLGMTDAQVRSMIDSASFYHGLLLITGPAGSGKTTTIYSLLSHVDCRIRSLISVEDPVEYRIPFANQQQVDEKRGVTFEALLQSSVSQNPDILYIGEVRDNYSARIAIDFAGTRHLSISTLRTANAAEAFFRLEQLGISRKMMADSITGIVAQRLIKKICPYCRVIKPLSDEERDMLRHFTANMPTETAHPSGCPKCGQTGYFGMEAVCEFIRFDPAVVDMVRAGEPIAAIRSFIHMRGDYLISRHAVEKIRMLATSVREVHEKILREEAGAANQ